MYKVIRSITKNGTELSKTDYFETHEEFLESYNTSKEAYSKVGKEYNIPYKVTGYKLGSLEEPLIWSEVIPV